MTREIVGDFIDTIVSDRNGYVLKYRFDRDVKVHKLYVYVSSTCDLVVYNSGKQVFPLGGKIRVYNVFLVLDLPEPLEFRTGEEIQFFYENNSGGNVRIIAGFTGVYG